MKALLDRFSQKSLKNALLLGAFVFSAAAAQAQVDGKAVFEQNCAACHSIQEQVVGPALKDVHKRRDEKWIKSFIENSTAMIAAGDAEAVKVYEQFGKIQMTSFKGSLSDDEITGVINYIKEESDKPVVAEAAPAEGGTQTAAAETGFDLKQAPPLVILAVAFAVMLLFGIVVLLVTLVGQLLPSVSEAAKPALANSRAIKLLLLARGDTTALTGKYHDVLIEDHDYDGIHEFDNDLPPWWKYMFYATIVFSFVYIGYYHVMKDGRTMEEEYQFEMQQAALLNPKGAEDGNPNEVTNYTALTAAADLESGKTLYMQNCAACHGQAGEGSVGPNLTDEYWLHGGDVNAVFKTIKFGVPSKGMVAWQKKLSNDQILQVSSYILSIQGTNPANAKAPQGEKHEPKN